MHSILIALTAAALAQEPAVSRNAADLKELHRLESVWNEAHLKADADALDELWANDLVVTVAAMRLMNKAEALEMVRSNRMPFSRYETSELNVRRFGDSAVVTGRLVRERTMNGKNVSDNWRFTKVYARTGGQWRVVAWHASPAAP
jgi:ketosteroid isomerase-like protein